MANPIVALVGRPNVGKSTLFNRLVGERKAVTSDIPGTTRDRIFGESDGGGVSFTVVDTGGIEVYATHGVQNKRPLSEGSTDFIPEIRAQAMAAIEEADVLILLVDADQGITAADEEVADILRKSENPIIVAANKADSERRRVDTVTFYHPIVGFAYHHIYAHLGPVPGLPL